MTYVAHEKLNNLTIEDRFEIKISKNIQPIRSYVLAIAINHLFSSKIFNDLYEKERKIKFFYSKYNFNEKKLLGFFWYLHNEKIINIKNDLISLTSQGKELKLAEPWYTMLIGGYGLTFHEMLENMTENKDSYCSRKAELVGLGSCGISQYDAIPLTRSLMMKAGKKFSCLLDLGCGNAAYLTTFCKQFSDIKAIGVEPSLDGFKLACEEVKNKKLDDRITVYNLTAQEFMNSNISNDSPDLIVLGFVLHEILGQDGADGVKDFLKKIIEKFPGIYLIIIEVDNKIQDENIMDHPLAKAYYNPYYLLHYFTQQKLISPSEWLDIFGSIGLECISVESTDKNVDSTGLEIGFLLKKVSK